MADFLSAVNKILQYEGGYVNDPDDPGGETNFGISKRQYPSLDIANLTRDQAVQIYYRDYWSMLRIGEIANDAIAEEVLDIAVNMGGQRAAKFLQEAVNLLYDANLFVDGEIGKRTIDAVNSYRYPSAIVKVLNGLQFEFYRQRVENHPDQRKFLRSWLNRVEFKEA